ncbi:MAG: alpha/beta hydrolase fold domain-containing protein [Steroidobacteraceae bacterium]
MALDPKIKAALEMPQMQLGAPPPGVTAPMIREASAAMRVPEEPVPVHAVRELTVRGAAGTLRARLYAPNSSAHLPVVVFFHGGGFVLCDLDTHDNICRRLANGSGAAVIAVEYRLSPEARFPAPLEDCYAALCDIVARAAELGVDAGRLAAAGDSAGANLATAVCFLARDRKGPAIRYQALWYPCVDATCNSTSMHEMATGYMLSRGIMQWFWECYVEKPDQLRDPLVSPVFATQLAGLPPASITTAEFDPLRDEGEQYADHLQAAGIPVVVRRYNGMIHGFISMPALTEQAANGVADLASDLKAALAPIGGSRLDTAQRMYQLALTGDFKTVETLVTDDFAIHEASALPFGGTYRGKGALQELLVKIGGMLKLKDVRFGGFMEEGDSVVSLLELVVDRGGRDEIIPLMERIRFRGALICELQPFYFDSAQVQACVPR